MCRGLERLHKAYDCVLNTEILFRLLLHNLPGDNPQQSEDASHISGGNCKMISRADTIGGTTVEKETDEGYDQLFLVSGYISVLSSLSHSNCIAWPTPAPKMDCCCYP